MICPKFPAPIPFKCSIKLHFKTQAFFSHSQIYLRQIFLEIAKNVEANLLDILIYYVYSNNNSRFRHTASARMYVHDISIIYVSMLLFSGFRSDEFTVGWDTPPESFVQECFCVRTLDWPFCKDYLPYVRGHSLLPDYNYYKKVEYNRTKKKFIELLY